MASTTACCPHHGRLEGQPTTAWHSLGGTKRKRKSENNVTPQSRRMSKWTGINTGHRHRSSVRPNWSQSQPCSRNGGNDSCRHDTVLYKGSGRGKNTKKKTAWQVSQSDFLHAFALPLVLFECATVVREERVLSYRYCWHRRGAVACSERTCLHMERIGRWGRRRMMGEATWDLIHAPCTKKNSSSHNFR